jgi:hypothetical protein
MLHHKSLKKAHILMNNSVGSEPQSSSPHSREPSNGRVSIDTNKSLWRYSLQIVSCLSVECEQ